jgi:alpha-beta hydrolase superfamily lysophospholipase
MLQASDGLELAYYDWEADEPAAHIILSHGYGEHAGRHAALAEALRAAGYSVHALDHRGHGRSEGERARVGVFREYVDDLRRFCERVYEAAPDARRVLLGHSVGGLIALQLVLEHPEKVDALALSAPYLHNAIEEPGWMVRLSGLLSRYWPGFPTRAVDPAHLSRDPAVAEAYRRDPLVFHGKAPVRVAREVLDAGLYVLARAADIHLPLLIMHGTADRIAALEGSRLFYETAGSSDEGYYHELFNEVGKEQVVTDLVAWCDARFKGAPAPART